MKKEEVELIIIGVKLGAEEALHMKIYKDGTLTRSGCGGLPTISVSGYTMEGETKYWDTLFPLIDERIIENPVNYEEKKINTPLEYFMAFYGVSSNGQTGEHAKWTKSTGVRFLLDNNTSFNHPLLNFLDQFVIKAAQITNEWFFDVMMSSIYNLEPIGLAPTFVTTPKTEKEKQEALANYTNQILANEARGWDIVKIGTDRKYKTKDGKELTSKVEKKGDRVSINFFETLNHKDPEAIERILEERFGTKNERPSPQASSGEQKPSAKKWWKFWE
ncbi:MAG: hypothetical protein AAFY48_19640 [Bacteroidota bacterium]